MTVSQVNIIEELTSCWDKLFVGNRENQALVLSNLGEEQSRLESFVEELRKAINALKVKIEKIKHARSDAFTKAMWITVGMSFLGAALAAGGGAGVGAAVKSSSRVLIKTLMVIGFSLMAGAGAAAIGGGSIWANYMLSDVDDPTNEQSDVTLRQTNISLTQNKVKNIEETQLSVSQEQMQSLMNMFNTFITIYRSLTRG